MQYFTQKDGALIFRRRHELLGERDCASARRKTENLPEGTGHFLNRPVRMYRGELRFSRIMRRYQTEKSKR